MQTVKAKLSAKYLYVRCDESFYLKFTNEDVMPFWKGFYCLLTDELAKYNTNNELEIVSSDSASVWWLSSDTLIMSVTDINDEQLQMLSQLSNNNVNANIAQLDALNTQTNLLMSIQNTLSTFLNTYVQLHNVVDYGFQTALIGQNNTCDLFIAKPSGGYTFNASLTFSRTLGTSDYEAKPVSNYTPGTSTVCFQGGAYVPKKTLFQPFFNFASSDIGSQTTGRIVASSVFPNSTVDFAFRLFDNENTLLSGYTVSNISCSTSFDFNIVGWDKVYAGYSGGKIQYAYNYKSVSRSYTNFISSTTFDNSTFKTGGATVTDNIDFNMSSGTSSTDNFTRSGTLSMTINFDVSYVPS